MELGLADPSLQYTDQLKDNVLRWLSIKSKKGTEKPNHLIWYWFQSLFSALHFDSFSHVHRQISKTLPLASDFRQLDEPSHVESYLP